MPSRRDSFRLTALALAPTVYFDSSASANVPELITSRADSTIYVRVGGSDIRGDGRSDQSAFATPQRALDSLPPLVEDNVVIDIGPGVYASSSRAADTLDRPAVIYIDRIHAGKRTDELRRGLSGALVLRLAPDAVIRVGENGFTHGIYCTGHTGSIAIWGGRVEARGRSLQLVTAHRGTYVHIRDTVIDGSGLATIGLCAEGGGILECVDVDAIGCEIDLQTYAASFAQMAAPGGTHRVGKVGVAPDSGASFFMAMVVGEKLVNRGTCELNGGSNGARCVLAGAYDGRGSILHVSRTDFTARTSDAVSATCDTWLTGDLRFDGVLELRGGAYFLGGSQSFTSGSRSSFQWPVRATAGTFVQRDAGVSWIDKSGAKVGVFRRTVTVAVAHDEFMIPVTFNSGERSVLQLRNTKGSLVRNCALDRIAAGTGGQPPDIGAEIVVCHTGETGIEIAGGANVIAGLPGGRVVLGIGEGMSPAIRMLWLDDGDAGRWVYVGGSA